MHLSTAIGMTQILPHKMTPETLSTESGQIPNPQTAKDPVRPVYNPLECL